MSFTQVTVTRPYRTASGALASGAVVFTPTRPFWNGGTVVAAPERDDITAGQLSISVAANTDPGTVPAGTGYKVEEFLDGVAAVRTYYVVVPHDQGATVALESLDFLLDEAGSVTVPIAGPQGEQGAPGQPGADGRAVLNGTGAPAAGTGIDGDFYIDTAADAIYGPKTGGAWGAATPLVGPQGPQGVPGDLTQATADGRYVNVTGDTMTGLLNVPALDSVKTNGSLTNKTFTTDITQIAQAPFAGLWHDLLAFHRGIGTPTYETSDGAIWTAATLDGRLFSMKEDQQFGIVNGTTVKAARWTWTGTDFSKGTWLVLGHAFISGGVSKTVTVESSADGTAWTTRHTSTYSTTAQPVWHWLADYIGDTRLRLTITWNSGGEIRLSTVRLLTARWGDQGGGREAEFPYEWDEQRRIGIGGPPDAADVLKVYGQASTTAAAPTDTDHLTRKDYVDTALAGKANTAHTHPVADLTATGSPSSTTFLRGDGTWATPTGGGGGIPLGGVIDCSAMTLASQVNAATLGAPAGTKVWLGPHGSGSELGIDETLILRPNMVTEGMGGRARLTRLKVTAGFPAGQPVVSAAGYLTNGAAADSPIVLRGVDIDANGKVGSHGLVIFNFWSLFEDIQVNNVTGNGTLSSPSAGAAAILLANRGVDGVTVTGNSHSENVLHDIRINAPAAGASFIVQQSFTNTPPTNNGAANQDGHLIGAWFAGGGAVGGGRGLDFARLAGWSLRDIHMYGIGDDAARILACYATDIDGLYIENYGTNDTAADNYSGIQAEFLRGRGSTFSNIKVSSSQADSPAASRLTNIHLRAGGSQVGAMVTISNCESNLNLAAAPTSRKTQAWRFGESGDTGRSLIVKMAGNQTDQLDGFMSPARFIHSTVILDEDGTTIPRTVPFAAAPTIDPTLEGDRVNITATAAITALAVSTTGARDRQVLQVAIGATGVGPWPVTFAAAIRVAGSLTRGPYSVPVGQVLLATVEYSALAAAWVLTDAGVSA